MAALARAVLLGLLSILVVGLARLAGAGERASAATPASAGTGGAPWPASGTDPRLAARREADASRPSAPRSADPSKPAPASASPSASAPGVATPETQAPARPRPALARGEDDGRGLGLGGLPPGVPPEYEGLGVTVLTRSTGRPAPNARVRAATSTLLGELARAGHDVDALDPDVLLGHSKDIQTTNATGVALASSEPGRMLVDARIGDYYGFAWVDRNKDSRVEIQLVPDRTLVIRTQDASGAGLTGVPVVVRDAGCADVWRATTSGADGDATLAHAGFVIERDAGPGDCVALVEGVLPDSPAVVIPRNAVPREAIVLSVPPHGRVRVRVSDPEGRLVTEPLATSLACHAHPEFCGRVVTRVLAAGVATFERVSPRTELDLVVSGGGVYADLALTARGPEQSGEERVVEARFTRRLPVLACRLLDPAGQPLSAARVGAWLSRAAGDAARHEPCANALETSPDGRLRLALPTRAEQFERLTLVVAAAHGGLKWTADVRWPVPIAAAIDAGDVRVEELPLIAAGHALDDRNAPIADTRIEVLATDDAGLSPLDFPVDPRWTTRCDERGRFQLRGRVDGARVAVVATAPGVARPEPVVVPRGEAKLKLVLPRFGAVSGRLLLPPRLPAEWLRVEVQRAFGAIPVSIDPAGSFRCAGLESGEVGLRVTVRGIDEPLFVLDGIGIRPGVDADDPRLRAIDLRSRVRCVTLYVLDEGDTPVGSGVVRWSEGEDDARRERSAEIEAGFARFVTPDPVIDVEVEVSGFERTRVAGVAIDRAVHLIRKR